MLLEYLFAFGVCAVVAETSKPNIVLIIADDLGWNDVGFHGSNAISTPNIDALAYSGVPLHNYYVTPICTPSRSALMTGKYPIHTGMQHSVIYGAEPRGLPLSETILPQYLKGLGYKTHLVGKWHLGSFKKEYTPLYRGFDSHLGHWLGKIDLYEHTSMERGSWGFDFRRGFEVAHDLYGKYATDVYTDEAIKIISSHNKSAPLFLTVAHSAVHSGNPNEPLRAPDPLIHNFTHIRDYQRQKFAGVLSKLDESVGRVVESLHSHGLLQNSIILFTTDNGGPAAGFNDNAASNYPLRGVKNTLWEGGVRGAGAVWSPLLGAHASLSTQTVHIVDWLPTLLHAAGYDTSQLSEIDGINQWEILSKDLPNVRDTVVHNIDDIWGSASVTQDHWKLHVGTNYNGSWDGWYGPGERDGTYNMDAVYGSRVGIIATAMGAMPERDKAEALRAAATVVCGDVKKTPCNPLVAPCLFNVKEDPCEYNNLAEKEPGVLQRLSSLLSRVNATAAAPNNRPADDRADPKHWGRLYTNFADYITEL